MTFPVPWSSSAATLNTALRHVLPSYMFRRHHHHHHHHQPGRRPGQKAVEGATVNLDAWCEMHPCRSPACWLKECAVSVDRIGDAGSAMQ